MLVNSPSNSNMLYSSMYCISVLSTSSGGLCGRYKSLSACMHASIPSGYVCRGLLHLLLLGVYCVVESGYLKA